MISYNQGLRLQVFIILLYQDGIVAKITFRLPWFAMFNSLLSIATSLTMHQ